MTKKGGRKSQSQDELAKTLFSETNTDSEPSPAKSVVKKTPRSSRKRKIDKGSENEKVSDKTEGLVQEMNLEVAEEEISQIEPSTGQAKKTPKSIKKTPKRKTPSRKVVNNVNGEEVTFNFEARSTKKSAKPQSIAKVENSTPDVSLSVTKATAQSVKKAKKTAGKDKTEDELIQPDDVAVEATPAAAEPEEVAMETEKMAAKRRISEMKLVKRPSAIKTKSKKRKTASKTKETPAKEKSEEVDDIFFYCGNLPPGVTKETMTYFFEEEGIHPKVTMKSVKKWDISKTLAKLTPKQREYKKNMMKAAKALFATIIVKTEEEAKKLLELNGISMPAPTHRDWDTNLKIVRRLPRPKNSPYKVHIGNLHPEVLENELKEYLTKRGIKPGEVVIIRRFKTKESKKYGFVWFESVREADRAVDLPEPTLRERALKIEHSFKKTYKNF